MPNLVVIKTFSGWFEAEMARALLKEKDIASIIKEDRCVTVPAFFNAVSLLVHEKDIQKGKEILGFLNYEFSREDGNQQLFYSNGKLYYDVPLKNGVRDGLYKEYYEDGCLRAEIEYRAGLRHGKMLLYSFTGQLLTSGQFENDKENGPFVSYYENGQKSFECLFRSGQVDGPWEMFYEDGVLKEKGVILNGKHEGPYQFYSSDGNLQEKIEFRDGIYISSERYSLTGDLIQKVGYKDQKLHGRCVLFNQEKTLLREDFYENGSIKWTKRYDKDGLVKTAIDYRELWIFLKLEIFSVAVFIVSLWKWGHADSVGDFLSRLLILMIPAQIPVLLIGGVYIKVVQPVFQLFNKKIHQNESAIIESSDSEQPSLQVDEKYRAINPGRLFKAIGIAFLVFNAIIFLVILMVSAFQ